MKSEKVPKTMELFHFPVTMHRRRRFLNRFSAIRHVAIQGMDLHK